jgi:signal transduction histidine kinase
VGELAQGKLHADPDAVRVALDALVENAVKHTESTDVIEVRSRAIDNRIAIEIADEGCGVPPELRDAIFQRFARAEPARNGSHDGLGLGLAIVDGIAKAHGGYCALEAPGPGSVFTLVLPGFEQARPDPRGVGERGGGSRQSSRGDDGQRAAGAAF